MKILPEVLHKERIKRMTDIMNLLAQASEAVEKTVSKVEKKGEAIIVEFSGKNGEELFIDQGVVLPVSLGFQPEVGMLALYTTESAGAMGDAADLTFKDSKGGILFSAHRNRGVGLDEKLWDVAYNKQKGISEKINEVRNKLPHKEADTNGEKDLSDKYAFYSASNSTTSETFIRLDKESGKVDHAFSCSPFTGLFYKNLDEKYVGKTFEELREDETLAHFSKKKVELKERTAQSFAQTEKMGINKTYGQERKF